MSTEKFLLESLEELLSYIKKFGKGKKVKSCDGIVINYPFSFLEGYTTGLIKTIKRRYK